MAKRGIDLVVGTFLAALATPLIVVLAIGAAISLRAWPFFTQDRIGQHGRHFRFLKIRTMPPTAPRYGLKPQIRSIELPWFCRLLRTYHLDELPQLYLVPLGRMSLVGPRPKMPDDHEPADAEYVRLRTLVPQGCTCLWQVGLATDGLPHESPEYDFWYLRHASGRLDLWILWRTALKMVGLGRPVSLDDIPAWTRGRGWVPDAVVHLPEFAPRTATGETRPAATVA